MQDDPQLLVLVSSRHRPLQSCVPGGHTPRQASLSAMQVPTQSFWPGRHEPPQIVPSHVALPPAGMGQAAHEEPQVATASLLTHVDPQTCEPAAQLKLQLKPSQ